MSDKPDTTLIQFPPPVPSPVSPPASPPRPVSPEEMLHRLMKLEAAVKELKQHRESHEEEINSHDDRLDQHNDRLNAYDFQAAQMNGIVVDLKNIVDRLTSDALRRGLVMDRVDRGLAEILMFVQDVKGAQIK